VPPPGAYIEGVRCATTRMHRNNPKAKLSQFIHSAEKIREITNSGVTEILMISEEGCLLEGLTSNFYAVLNGAIYTSEEGVLLGITRQLVLEEATKAGIEVILKCPQATGISRFEEAFITSSSRAVLPVTQIDQTVIQSGKVGPVTKKLIRLYRNRIQKETEQV